VRRTVCSDSVWSNAPSTQMLEKRSDFGIDPAQVVDAERAASSRDSMVSVAYCSAEIEAVGRLGTFEALVEATFDARSSARSNPPIRGVK
jgi:hypothetical protein